jgi:threonine/homoserine/homoserine lactone efflux protein
MIWLVFGAGLKRYLDNAFHNRIFNIIMALLLVISMVPVINSLVDRHAV